MSEATEMLERMEHVGHSGGGHGGHGGPGKGIGITMAILGVMLAFCAAMVGSSRTELIKATVEQSNKWGIYQAESTKFRVMEADYEMLHALTPSKAEIKKFELKLHDIKRAGGKEDDEDTAELKEAIHVATVELAEVLTPDKEDEERILATARKYKHDMHEAKEDAEAYEGAIEAHHEGAEGYERSQLCAEIGIVIASIALLMANKFAWIVAIIMGVLGGTNIGITYVHTRGQLKEAEHKIEEAVKRTAEIEKDDDDDGEVNAEKKPEGAHGGGVDKKPEGAHGGGIDKKDEAKPPHEAPKDPHAPEKPNAGDHESK